MRKASFAGAGHESGAFNQVRFSIGVQSGTVINVGIQLQDGVQDVGERCQFLAYLSDDANGDSIAATAPSGGWAIGTDGLLIPVVANKAAHFVSEADGDVDIAITQATSDVFYLIVALPDGRLVASPAITFVTPTTTTTTGA